VSNTSKANALIEKGRPDEAVSLLREAAKRGDGEACFTFAAWALAGQVIQRDLQLALHFFGKAVEAGVERAFPIHTALLGNGGCGARNWPLALSHLEARSISDIDIREQRDLIADMTLDAAGNPTTAPHGRPIAKTPRSYFFERLFSAAECAYLARSAAPLFQPSVVVDPRTGAMIEHPIRTSDAAAFPMVFENPAIHALNRRIAAASGSVVEQGEPLQILRYQPGQQYRAHSDVIPGAANQRVMTMLVYLNENYEGGETMFLKSGLRVRGRTGDALLFWNVDRGGQPDEEARHAGLPVTSGTKLICSRWIRAHPLDLTCRQ
jgi:prolyl 4-hydroxylase